MVCKYIRRVMTINAICTGTAVFLRKFAIAFNIITHGEECGAQHNTHDAFNESPQPHSRSHFTLHAAPAAP